MNKGEYLRKLRQQKGMSLSVLSEIVGVTAPAISRFENGLSDPPLSRVEGLFRVFGHSLVPIKNDAINQ